MKKVMILGVLLASGVLFSQEIKPKFEVVDQMVKATYFHDNGQIKEQGFYLDGKLHGKWVSFDEEGTRKAIGEYESGKKVGKWFFWNENSLNEVDFNDSRIAEVKKWSKEALANN